MRYSKGDTVKILNTDWFDGKYNHLTEYTTKIVEVDADDDILPYKLEMPDGGPQWIQEKDIELVSSGQSDEFEPKFQIGQKVRCKEHGTEFKIGVIDSGDPPILYYDVCPYHVACNEQRHGSWIGVPEKSLELVEDSKSHKFKVGDKVRIGPNVSAEKDDLYNAFDGQWFNMKEFVGLKGEIIRISGIKILVNLKNCKRDKVDWTFFQKDLILIDSAEEATLPTITFSIPALEHSFKFKPWIPVSAPFNINPVSWRTTTASPIIADFKAMINSIYGVDSGLADIITPKPFEPVYSMRPQLTLLQKIEKLFNRRKYMNQQISRIFKDHKLNEAELVEKHLGNEFNNSRLLEMLLKGKEQDIVDLAKDLEKEEKEKEKSGE
jgi:hypothetical protein